MSLARSFPDAPSRPRLHHHSGDTRPWQRAISRRTFVGGALGATGIALTSGLWQSAIARAAVGTGAAGSAAPRPIPGGTQIDPFGFFHFHFPGHGNEPSSITDFNGHVGIADVVGTGTGTDPDTGDLIPLTFDCDMRFMSGEYVGLDGISHHGTFGFIWMDVFKGPAAPDFSNQIHDFNPGIAESGLFWTQSLPTGTVEVHPGSGSATMSATDLSIEDYGNVANALTDGPSLEATVSFSVVWEGGGSHTKIRDQDTDFGGRYVEGTATMEWSGSNENGEVFQSDARSTSSALFAEVGHERNGSFFP